MAETLHQGATAQTARAVCVVVHGRGQTQQDMIDMILSRLEVADVHYVLPKSEGEAWYDAKAVDPLEEGTTRQLDAALDAIGNCIDAARQDGLPLVLIGFSQGACMAAEWLMRGGKVTSAALLTACRVGAVQDDLVRADLAGLPVYTTNGDDDPWIPLWAHRKLVGELSECGARLRMDIFPGRGHEVSDVEIETLSEMLEAAVAGQRALEAAS
ncbi:dienelactone hydrolase family protein [Sulfitobacter sp. G21635-S1]|uniref:alpha/beta hydrolase n=1 Tax=Sulfitobacter sp. G21635-S1 TaxID=3014043 RepID=UPI0022AFB1D1|nr:dienelactone hydrolase family protein [Sulfitobacter sp. G21635-S1]MCZ4256677.1 dienelactone hydrolase family protein [Sulfitobacter sp. G21635-S1]